MNEQRANQPAAGEPGGYGPCLCREFFTHLRDCLGISPSVQQHLANSRIEFLKAVRAVLDARIEHLSKTGQPGTKINVE